LSISSSIKKHGRKEKIMKVPQREQHSKNNLSMKEREDENDFVLRYFCIIKEGMKVISTVTLKFFILLSGTMKQILFL